MSVSVIGTQEGMSDEALTAAVLKELSAWFGADQTATWSHLRTYRSEGTHRGTLALLRVAPLG